MLTNSITFRNSLVNQGFDVTSVSLKDQDIPGDIAALVIADPKVALDTTSMLKIQQYIAAGGNLLIAGEPGKQEMLNPILQPLGVHLMDGMLVQKSKDFSPDLILSFMTDPVARFTKKLQQDADDSLPVSLRGAAALSYENNGPFAVTPLLMTNGKSSWNKKVRPNQDEIESSEDAGESAVAMSGGGMIVTSLSDKQKTKFPQITYAPELGDQKGPSPAILGLTRTINGRQQRIVVAGDADFLSNSELGRYNPRTSNFNFGTALFSWFTNGAFPIDSSRPPSRDKHINLTDGSFYFLKVLLLGILPGLLLIMGSILLIRRKRK
jgi:ABC-2 type transport system permease protein